VIRTYIASGPTLERFHASDEFVRSIIGPVGSGKSSAMCAEIIRRAYEQKPSPDGRRRSRWVAIRNTYGELRTTTIKTWHHWFPEQLGKFSLEAPISHRLVSDDLDFEILFLALDRPADVAKLLSLELTGGWVNEAREVPKAIVDALTARVGRFPPVSDGGPTWSGLILDGMPPDNDHWIYRLAEEERPDGWAFFRQPAGDGPDAENLNNLPGGARYYERIRAGKSDAWCKVYISGQYGYVGDDRAVFSEYVDATHCAEKAFPPSLDDDLVIGIDVGLEPAAVICQRDARGRWLILAELVAKEFGAERFGRALANLLAAWFPDHMRRPELIECYADPSAGQRSQVDERAVVDVLRQATGIPVKLAPSNDIGLRLEAVRGSLSRMIDGKPGFVLSPACEELRKALNGKYFFRRVQVGSDERYEDKPFKNKYSHVADALQYALLGSGEGRALVSRRKYMHRQNPTHTDSSYSIHDW
jgi:hypothetical protein